MPDNIKAEVEKVRKDEIDKRKKVWEEKEAQAEREGRLTKKMIREREREAKERALRVCAHMMCIPLCAFIGVNACMHTVPIHESACSAYAFAWLQAPTCPLLGL